MAHVHHFQCHCRRRRWRVILPSLKKVKRHFMRPTYADVRSVWQCDTLPHRLGRLATDTHTHAHNNFRIKYHRCRYWRMMCIIKTDKRAWCMDSVNPLSSIRLSNNMAMAGWWQPTMPTNKVEYRWCWSCCYCSFMHIAEAHIEIYK